jgi:DNA-binding FrmR family transcriptional regulator
MPDMNNVDPERRQDLIDRLKRIEGQARGIRKMIEDGRDCDAVIQQVSAMKAATHSLSGRLLEVYLLHCLTDPEALEAPEKTVSQVVGTLVRAGR